MKLTNAQQPRLWQGSLLKLRYDGGYLSREHIDIWLAKTKTCDDLTRDERKLVEAIELDLKLEDAQ